MKPAEYPQTNTPPELWTRSLLEIWECVNEGYVLEEEHPCDAHKGIYISTSGVHDGRIRPCKACNYKK